MYDKLREFTCRKGEMDDLEAIYDMASKYVVNPEGTKSMQDRDLRILYKVTQYSIKTGTCVVCTNKEDKVVGVATQVVNSSVTTLVSEGGIYATLLLYKVVFCDMHNRFGESTFEVVHKELNKVYYNIRTPSGKACSIDDTGKGVVNVQAKGDLLEIFNRLSRREYEP